MTCELCFYNKHSTEHNAFAVHRHTCYEIVYFLSGKGEAHIGGERYPFRPNSFCIIPPGTEHTECIDGTGEVIFLGFRYEDPEITLLPGMFHSNGMLVNTLMQGIMKESNEGKRGYEIIVRARLAEMLVRLSRMSERDPSPLKSIEASAAYIDEFYNQKIDFRELALMSGYSVDYFRHRFKECYGLSPQSYQMEIRLQRAAEFLASSHLNCTEVGYICGFPSSSQFSRLFRERFGISPKAYKASR